MIIWADIDTNKLFLYLFQACSSILIAFQVLNPSISSQNEILHLLISLTQTPLPHLSLITTSLQQSVSRMMEDTSDPLEESDKSATELIGDENRNTIKCGVSEEVVTMDVEWSTIWLINNALNIVRIKTYQS